MEPTRVDDKIIVKKEMLSIIDKKYLDNTMMWEEDDIVLCANDYISKNFTSVIGLNEIADYLTISPGYLSKVYKEKTGMTITNAINNQRIELATTLLVSSGKSVTEIAKEVGLKDSLYFSRFLKKYTGQSPQIFKYFYSKKIKYIQQKP